MREAITIKFISGERKKVKVYREFELHGVPVFVHRQTTNDGYKCSCYAQGLSGEPEIEGCGLDVEYFDCNTPEKAELFFKNMLEKDGDRLAKFKKLATTP